MSAPAVLFAAIASAVSLTADDARLRREYARSELVRYLGKDASSSVVLADAVGTEGLGEDGFRIRAANGRITVTGGRRGLLYGVYELLENYAGIEWFSHDFECVPPKPLLSVPDGTDIIRRPDFITRDMFWFQAMNRPDFAARLRLNGSSMGVSARHGGAANPDSVKLWKCHTFYKLCDPAKYAKSNPEFFSERDGSRKIQHGETQLCLTNPELVKIVTENLLAVMRSEPDRVCFSVSQMDWKKFCMCAACRAVNDEECSEAGTYVRFLNSVAEKTAKIFPDKIVTTMAYQFTRKPPKTRLHPNAGVIYAAIDRDMARPFGCGKDERNYLIPSELMKWGALTQNFFVWDYTTDFHAYPLPYPNVRTFQPNLQIMKNANVRHVFMQGAWNGNLASFAAFKTWLLAHLMWDVNADVEKLSNRFFKGYYGAAHPYVKAYFDELESLPNRYPATSLAWNESPSSKMVDDAFLEKAEKLLDQALAAVKGDEFRTRHVREESFSVAWTRLARCCQPLRVTRDIGAAPAPEKMRKWLLNVLSAVDNDAFKPVRFSENKTSDALLLERFRKMLEYPPVYADKGEAVAEESILNLACVGRWGEFTEDAAASDGRAMKLYDTHHQWCVQQAVAATLAYDSGGMYELRLRVRVDQQENAAADDIALEAGIWNNDERRPVAAGAIRMDEMDAKGYKWHTLFRWRPDSSQKFWIAPGKPGKSGLRGFKSVYVDQVSVRRVE